MRRALTATAVIALALAGCGGDDAGSSEAGSSEEVSAENAALALAERIPGTETAIVSIVDLVAAREALGLPEGANPDPIDGTDEEKRYVAAAGAAIPHLRNPAETPMGEALDLGTVTAAASNATLGPESVTVFETDQSFDEVAATLEGRGYERKGDVLTNEEELAASIVYPVVAGGEGVIAAGQEAAAVEAAAAGVADPAPSGLDRELLAELDTPSAAASSFEGTSDCVTALGIGDDLAGGEGKLILVSPGAAESVELRTDDANAELIGPFDSYEFGEPSVEGDRVVYPFTYALGDFVGPLAVVFGDAPTGTLWDCG